MRSKPDDEQLRTALRPAIDALDRAAAACERVAEQVGQMRMQRRCPTCRWPLDVNTDDPSKAYWHCPICGFAHHIGEVSFLVRHLYGPPNPLEYVRRASESVPGV